VVSGENMTSKIAVAGSSGLVGKAVMKKLGYLSLEHVGMSRVDADFLNYESTRNLIHALKPTCVIDAAAVVGGIKYNSKSPVKFLVENLEIQNNLMRASYEANVEKFIFLGSSCVYPRNCPQPIKEEYLLTGELESSNSAYAVAKIAGIELIKSYRKQYAKKWISLMPSNIYGPNDSFDLENSHVIPALIKKFIAAKNANAPTVEVWGTGKARREFLFVDDLADAILFCMENYDSAELINIGFGSDITIQELANIISEIVGFCGKITFNPDVSDGTPRKLLDSSKILSLGWKPSTPLYDGLKSTVDWYLKNYSGPKNAN
jgi:GDP-L-fucose synthase